MTAVPPAAVTAALLRAIADPGSILPRLRFHGAVEPLPEWQARAVLEAAAPHIAAQAAAAERDRIRQGIAAIKRAPWRGNGYMWPRHLDDLLGPQHAGADAEPGDDPAPGESP